MTEMRKFNIRGVSVLMPENEAMKFNAILSKSSDQPELGTMIAVDENGLINSFSPGPNVSWGLIFFIQNLMISQRLYLIDSFLMKNGAIK